MSTPIEVDIPHRLGLAGARARIEGGFRHVADHIPGGSVTEHRWEGNTLTFVVEALGQRIASRLDLFESHVHAVVDLPAFMALFAGTIRSRLTREGQELLK